MRGETLWIGFFNEEALTESSVQDVNRNGLADDAFGLVAFYDRTSGEPRVVIDLDGDGDLSDETVRGNFEKDLRHFSFPHPDPKKDQTPVAFTVTVMPDEERKVELHFDDGGHGTHCAASPRDTD